jgi:hypothetical protein
MKVSFALSASDIRYFRDRLKQVRQSGSAREEQLVIQGAEKLVRDALAAEPPDFVRERIARASSMRSRTSSTRTTSSRIAFRASAISTTPS